MQGVLIFYYWSRSFSLRVLLTINYIDGKNNHKIAFPAKKKKRKKERKRRERDTKSRKARKKYKIKVANNFFASVCWIAGGLKNLFIPEARYTAGTFHGKSLHVSSSFLSLLPVKAFAWSNLTRVGFFLITV